jgi:cytochrome c-type biogenesis protein CcmH/NrfG
MRRRRFELGLMSITAALTSAGWWSIATLGADDDPPRRPSAHPPLAGRGEPAPCTTCSVDAQARPTPELARSRVAPPRVDRPEVAPVESDAAPAAPLAVDADPARGAVAGELARLLAGFPDGLEPTVDLWLAFATLHAQAGRPEDAARCVEAALGLDPEDETAREALAELPAAVRRPLLERLVAAQPTNDELIGDLADAAAETGDTRASLEAYLRAMETDPRDSEWAGKVAELDPARGAALLERAAAARPDDAEILANLAQVYFAQGRDAAALPALERALALDPDEQVAGRLVKLDAARAVTLLERALASTPDKDELWGDLAEGYAALDRTADAVRAFRRARELDPEDQEWSQRLLALDPASELASAEQRARATPRDDELWGDLGDAYAAAGRAQDALGAYRRAAELDPDDGEWTPKIAELEGR